MLRALQGSASVRAACALGVGGAAFAIGNLVLAGVLTSAQYGIICLVIGILSVAGLTAPLGLDLVIARRGLALRGPLRTAVLGLCCAAGVLTALVCALAYALPLTLLICIAVATASSGIIQAGVAHFQGQQKFGIAAWLLQISNAVMIPVALLTQVAGAHDATTPALLIAASTVLGAAATWRIVGHAGSGEAGPESRGHSWWREAAALVSITLASALFMQLERLVLAPAIGLHGLALFGVVASLVASPFRMLQAAVLFTLMPALRATAGVAARRRLLGREFALVASCIACGSALIWFIAPVLAHVLLHGRYDLTHTVMAAAIVSGLLKVCSAFSTSTAVALGSEGDLRKVGRSAWLAIGAAAVGAFACAPWGLAGVLYGISAGWLLRTLAAAWIAAPHLVEVRGDLPHPVG